ncbi:hypothetical protein ACFPVX_22840 [Cohnella faecalis]|uniref:Uncharacterized protein n=1 Tax=Cohnella faecalis TaxID=2315694 RepID=A0A398CJX3_9BACL|nr:hypothetical protein [Cohnella faecalis]RIE02442.1 hypothetical protein D3H35_17205 [Cohnella faecalis]
MSKARGASTLPARSVVRWGDATYRIEAPTWFAWQDAMERSTRTDGNVDAQRLLEEALAVTARDENDQRLSIDSIRLLSALDGDRLLAGTLELIERQRQYYAFREQEQPDGSIALLGNQVYLKLQSWTFGERNDVLRRSLRLENGQAAVDMALYERMMILACVRTGEDTRLQPSELSGWTVPFGEKVLELLDQLNGIESRYDELLQACLDSGQHHPDLDLIQLCRTFGWYPDRVLGLDAQLAERLSAGVRILKKSGLLADGPAASRLPSAMPAEAAAAASYNPQGGYDAARSNPLGDTGIWELEDGEVTTILVNES